VIVNNKLPIFSATMLQQCHNLLSSFASTALVYRQ
jgi:hypothetical protein